MPNISLWKRVFVEQSQTQNLSSLKGITASAYSIENGVFAFVPGLGLFQFAPASSATADDINVIQPTSGTGRWLRVTQAAPTVNSIGQLYLSNIDLPLYQVTVNGSGTGDYTTIEAALTAGYTDILVTGDTTETVAYVFAAGTHSIRITLLAGVQVHAGNISLYDASTNAATVTFVVNGISNPLETGYVWSPTATQSLFDFASAASGSRISFNHVKIDAAGASATTYHAVNAGGGISFFGNDIALFISNAAPNFIVAPNLYVEGAQLSGVGSTSAALFSSVGGTSKLSNITFEGNFSSTVAVINAPYAKIDQIWNDSVATILITGSNVSVSNFEEISAGSGLSVSVDSNTFFQNINTASGSLILKNSFTASVVDDCVFSGIDESAATTFGKLTLSNTTLKAATPNIGNHAAGVWAFENVNFDNSVSISAKNMTYSGGSIGTFGSSKTITINAGAFNTLVTNVRTDAAIVNNEPSVILGTNPLFA